MRKETAREIWDRCLRLVVRGHAAEQITNPLKGFAQDHRAGIHDTMDLDDVAEWAQDCNELTVGMWDNTMERSAGDILLNALASTDIPGTKLCQIVDVLAECSAHSIYKDEQETAQTQSSLKSALERSNAKFRRCVLDGYSPKQIAHWLHTSGGIVGQNNAVKTASLIMFNHANGRPSVSLFCGPTGSGKSAVWRALQREYGTDRIVIHDASSLTAEGWKGANKISTIFQSIAPENRGHIILVLDEFDKLLEPQIGSNGTNFSDIVQNQLLKLFDHDTIFFGDESGKGDGFTVDASGISVVLLGAFQRLLEQKSENTGIIGFGGQSHQTCNYSNTEITFEDLIEYGMREEIAGRITRICSLSPLDEKALMRIARNEIRKLSDQMQREVLIDNNTLSKLANEALDKGLGARWLNSQLSIALDELVFEDPNAGEYVIGCEQIDAQERRSA